MFVIQPDPYSLPSYRIGPFRTADVGLNHRLPDDSYALDYFNQRFSEQRWAYTNNGRHAIHQALAWYQLKPSDVVTILTTTQNFYISGCVTREIERFCRWNREISADTKLILVNHEFGYPYQKLEQLRALHIPIIEDCCTTFFSDDGHTPVSRVGDFVVYSFPKFFPIQVGGLIVSNLPDSFQPQSVSDIEQNYYTRVLSYYLRAEDELLKARSLVYQQLCELLAPLHLVPRFDLQPGIVPSVFMFRSPSSKINYPDLKSWLWSHGIQCSVFYGEEAFFIPAHQALCYEDLLYFKQVIKTFIQKNT